MKQWQFLPRNNSHTHTTTGVRSLLLPWCSDSVKKQSYQSRDRLLSHDSGELGKTNPNPMLFWLIHTSGCFPQVTLFVGSCICSTGFSASVPLPSRNVSITTCYGLRSPAQSRGSLSRRLVAFSPATTAINVRCKQSSDLLPDKDGLKYVRCCTNKGSLPAHIVRVPFHTRLLLIIEGALEFLVSIQRL
jgi:hypothetical protein